MISIIGDSVSVSLSSTFNYIIGNFRKLSITERYRWLQLGRQIGSTQWNEAGNTNCRKAMLQEATKCFLSSWEFCRDTQLSALQKMRFRIGRKLWIHSEKRTDSSELNFLVRLTGTHSELGESKLSGSQVLLIHPSNDNDNFLPLLPLSISVFLPTPPSFIGHGRRWEGLPLLRSVNPTCYVILRLRDIGWTCKTCSINHGIACGPPSAIPFYRHLEKHIIVSRMYVPHSNDIFLPISLFLSLCIMTFLTLFN